MQLSVKNIIALCLLLLTLLIALPFQLQAGDTTGWNYVPVILQSIVPPQFPDRDLLVTLFGARGDGTTDCTQAFTLAIDSCNNAGGGRIVVPAGTYLTGAIHLKSNVNLFVDSAATIKFSTDPAKYMPVVYTRFESVECMNFSPLIYAFEQTNIAITGKGTLDGQATSRNWWAWKILSMSDTTILNTMVANALPVEQRIFGSGHYLRPNFFQPYRCTNVLVQGVTFKDSPMWGVNPVLCKNVSILNVSVTANSSDTRPNTDGCDPECCTNVLMKGCFFSNGDDCIAIKSGRNADGRRVNVPCSNVVIQNCKMQDGHGGITMGSETTGSIYNIYAENDTLNSANLQYALRFKTNTLRGGTIENIYERNIAVLKVSNYIIYIDCKYGGETGSYIPIVRNIYFDTILCTQAPRAIYMMGLPASPISNIVLTNCTFTNITNTLNAITDVTGLRYNNVSINGTILTGVEQNQTVTPGKFELQQNYPNPFNPSTTLKYTIVQKSFVRISVYTILGQEIEVLVHEEKLPGSYSVLFNGRNLSSGVYLCRMQVGNYSASQKFVLAK
jgi:hypothetical protein